MNGLFEALLFVLRLSKFAELLGNCYVLRFLTGETSLDASPPVSFLEAPETSFWTL